MKSHLISQVVLKQFANKQREVQVHQRGTDTAELKRIDRVAFVEIEEAIIQHLEEKWSHDIEDQAEKAINNLKNGNVMYFEKHIGTIKSLMALHYIRSQVFRLVEAHKHEMAVRFAEAKAQVLAVYPNHGDLIDREAAKYATKAPLDMVIRLMEEYIPKVEEFLAKPDLGFEIGEAPEGTMFIIGDVPVVTTDGNGNFGIFAGVPITNARSIAMPLTPKHLVALKKNPETQKYKKLEPKQVETANSRQLGLMTNEYYSKP
jgi:hypothetical protein